MHKLCTFLSKYTINITLKCDIMNTLIRLVSLDTTETTKTLPGHQAATRGCDSGAETGRVHSESDGSPSCFPNTVVAGVYWAPLKNPAPRPSPESPLQRSAGRGNISIPLRTVYVYFCPSIGHYKFIKALTISFELSVRINISPSTPCCTVSAGTLSFPRRQFMAHGKEL